MLNRTDAAWCAWKGKRGDSQGIGGIKSNHARIYSALSLRIAAQTAKMQVAMYDYRKRKSEEGREGKMRYVEMLIKKNRKDRARTEKLRVPAR